MNAAPPIRRKWWLVALLIGAGLALRLPAVGWGFVWDDFYHQLVLRRLIPAAHLPRWNLYDFRVEVRPGHPLFEAGFVPWWTDPEFKARFFRPVTSLSIWLDYALFGDWAPGYHLTSLLLFGVFLLLAWRLYIALGAPPRAALWALAILALDDIHCLPVGWIANRNTLLAATFLVATVLTLVAWWGSGRRRWLIGAVLFQSLALGSKESGIAGVPIAIACLLWLRRKAACDRALAPPAGAQVAAVACFLAIAALYAGVYLLGHYGPRSLAYPVPWHEPGHYAARLGLVLPIGLMSLTFGTVTDLAAVNPNWLPRVLIAAALLLPPVVVVTGWTLRRSPPAGFAAIWLLLALLAEGGGDVSDRLWMSAAVGSALLFGLFLDRLPPVRARCTVRGVPALLVGGVLVLSGVAAAIPMGIIRNGAFAELGRFDRSSILNADIAAAVDHPRDVLLLNSPSSMGALSFGVTWRVLRNDPQTRVFPLQYGRRALLWKREDARTVTLTSLGAPLRANLFERVFCAQRTTPTAGTVFRTPAFTATVLASEPGGFRSVQFAFEHDLDDERYRFLAWQGGRWSRIPPPAVGQTMELPAAEAPGPLVP